MNTLSHSLDQAVTANYSGPTLTIDTQKITEQVALFKYALPHVTPHYAVKANPLPEVLRHLHSLGVGFEIASQGELSLLQSLGIPAHKIIFSNPIKTPASIIAAVDYGVKYFAFDNPEELIKLHQLAPEAQYELRISTNGKGSVWPLTKKFGVDVKQAIKLIGVAHHHQINISALTFHVGSQCTQSQAWLTALKDCEKIIQYMNKQSMQLNMLNIGGGFPCALHSHGQSFKELMNPVRSALKLFKQKTNVEVCAEPGRFLVASSGTLACQIISTTQKNHQPWAFLDCGYYNGLMELTEDFGYQLRSKRTGENIPWTIAGPTCDSVDCFTPKYHLPKNSQAGDVITIDNMGAYAHTCVSNFNGFDGPSILIKH